MNRRICLPTKQSYYLVFFVLIEFVKSDTVIRNDVFDNTLTIIAAMAFFIHMWINRYTRREIFFVIITLCLGVLLYINTAKNGMILTIAAVVGIKNVKINDVLKLTFIVKIINYCITIGACMLGIISAEEIVHNRINGSVIRYGFGFGHPNQFHLFSLILIVLYVYFRFQKINLRKVLLIEIINICIFYFSQSRTGLIAGVFLGILIIIYRYGKQWIKRTIAYLVVPICFAVSVVPVIFFKGKLFWTIDSLLSYRNSFSKWFIESYGIHMLGNNLEEALSNGGLIDCSYVSMLVNCGIIYTAMYLILTVWVIHCAVREHRNDILVIISFFAVYGITESFLPNAFTNLGLLFIGYYLFENKKRNEDKYERASHIGCCTGV